MSSFSGLFQSVFHINFSASSYVTQLSLKFYLYLSDVMEQALSVGFSAADDYRNLWLGYIDYVRRKVDWSADHQSAELAELRGTFNRACEHLAQCE
jgi:hypothetical protein